MPCFEHLSYFLQMWALISILLASLGAWWCTPVFLCPFLSVASGDFPQWTCRRTLPVSSPARPRGSSWCWPHVSHCWLCTLPPPSHSASPARHPKREDLSVGGKNRTSASQKNEETRLCLCCLGTNKVHKICFWPLTPDINKAFSSQVQQPASP